MAALLTAANDASAEDYFTFSVEILSPFDIAFGELGSDDTFFEQSFFISPNLYGIGGFGFQTGYNDTGYSCSAM